MSAHPEADSPSPSVPYITTGYQVTMMINGKKQTVLADRWWLLELAQSVVTREGFRIVNGEDDGGDWNALITDARQSCFKLPLA